MRYIYVILLLSLTSSFSKADNKYKLDTYDVYAAPIGGVGVGSYKAGGIDDGKFASVLYGGKLGVKVGPLLLGAEYLEGSTTAESSKTSVSDADRMLYQEPDQAKFRGYGVSVGFNVKRVSVWASYFLQESLVKDAIVAGTSFEHTYHGDGFKLEASVQVWNLVHVGAFYHQHNFKKYSSTHSAGLADKEDFDPKMTASTFGINLSYLIPYSQIKKFIK